MVSLFFSSSSFFLFFFFLSVPSGKSRRGTDKFFANSSDPGTGVGDRKTKVADKYVNRVQPNRYVKSSFLCVQSKPFTKIVKECRLEKLSDDCNYSNENLNLLVCATRFRLQF